MSGDLDDLLPLFLAEANERLEHLAQVTSGSEFDSERAAKARRELHALKGATRMMGMIDLSKICHQAEDVLNPLTAESRELLVPIIDRLVAEVMRLSRGTAPGLKGEEEVLREVVKESSVEDKRQPVNAVEPDVSQDVVRIPAKVLSELSDRSVRCRVVASAGVALADNVFRLAGFAEKSVNDKQPEQALASLATSLRQLGMDFETHQRTIQYSTERQLDTLLGLQVQPLKPYLLNLARHARELARALGKEIEVRVDADDGQLDRRIIEALKEAFLHLVRNAVDHGIENREERKQTGKPARGLLSLGASTEGARVTIVVSDDGGGIDPDEIVSVAVAAGLIHSDDAARLSRAERLQLICLPGFSTREEATGVSGRGIGMEAVAEAVRSVGGDIIIDSELRVGTKLRLMVPVARRGENLLILRAGRHHVAIPKTHVRSFRRISADKVISDGGRHILEVENRTISVRLLQEDIDDRSSMILIEGEVGGTSLAMLVDDVIGEEEVFLRPLKGDYGAPDVFDSIAVLSNGRPVPVISPQRLLIVDKPVYSREKSHTGPVALRVLLVDDSAVTREMIRRLLEDGGFDVRAIASAEQALQALSQSEFDCVVTDIEMPGMDGLELTRHLRETPQFAHLPIVVVSTRDRPQDRLAGLEAGADAYLTKQGLDAKNLIRLVTRVGG